MSLAFFSFVSFQINHKQILFKIREDASKKQNLLFLSLIEICYGIFINSIWKHHMQAFRELCVCCCCCALSTLRLDVKWFFSFDSNMLLCWWCHSERRKQRSNRLLLNKWELLNVAQLQQVIRCEGRETLEWNQLIYSRMKLIHLVPTLYIIEAVETMKSVYKNHVNTHCCYRLYSLFF